MNRRLNQLFSTLLSEAGVLAPVRLGEGAGAKEATVEPAQVAQFAKAMESCRTSMRRQANVLYTVSLVLLLTILFLLYRSDLAHSTIMIKALGSSGAVGLIIIPVRMHSIWRDVVLMDITLAILPGQSPKEQLALIKTLHAAGRSRARA